MSIASTPAPSEPTAHRPRATDDPVRPLPTLANVTVPMAIRVWPTHLRLAAVVATDPENPGWSVLGVPTRTRTLQPGATPDTLRALLDEIQPDGSGGQSSSPFTGGWIGYLSYEAGRLFEPKGVDPARQIGTPGPLAHFEYCPAAYLYHAETGQWFKAGDTALLPTLTPPTSSPPTQTASAAGAKSRTSRQDYEQGVQRVVEYLRAGDAFQVNLTRQIEAKVQGSPREIATALFEEAAPRHGGYIESEDGSDAVISLSPELFLAFDPTTRLVTTRPMKGTRPGNGDPQELAESPKDRAELNMIIDLMRNDLGRVCEFGSVRVTQPRQIQRHARGGILQAIGEVQGRLRESKSLTDLLEATFPPGSITGAPKVRAMQIIDELETHPRGPYCGCMGYVSNSGHASFNVAIRTATLSGSTLRYGVGAGIVADSTPDAEWHETEHKAGVFTPGHKPASGSDR